MTEKIVSEADYEDFYESCKFIEVEDLKNQKVLLKIKKKYLKILPGTLDLLLDELELYSCQIQNWYQNLKKFTMYTIFYDLTDLQIENLLAFYIISPVKRNILVSEIHQECLKILAAQKTCEVKKWFIRTGECSPKDQPFEYFSNCDVKDRDSFYHAIVAIVNSARCRQGFQNYPILEKSKNFKHCLALRSFQECKDEYRCFIFQDRLTAVCEHDGRFTSYKSQEQRIQFLQQVCDFIYKKVIKILPFHKVIVDICRYSETDFGIVECNPFNSKWTGSALFSWSEDAHLLYNITQTVYRYQLFNDKECTIEIGNEYLNTN